MNLFFFPDVRCTLNIMIASSLLIKSISSGLKSSRFALTEGWSLMLLAPCLMPWVTSPDCVKNHRNHDQTKTSGIWPSKPPTTCNRIDLHILHVGSLDQKYMSWINDTSFWLVYNESPVEIKMMDGYLMQLLVFSFWMFKIHIKHTTLLI